MLGFGAYPIGGVEGSCFCGWQQEGLGCVIPGAVCQGIGSWPNCTYERGTPRAAEVVALALEGWASQPGWECPELDLSDAWGVLHQEDGAPGGNGSHAWVTGTAPPILEADVRRTLVDGRAGLRVGNIRTLADDMRRAGLGPNARASPRESSSGDTIALKRCGTSILDESVDSSSVARQVVDDLFPVAYAAKEGGPASVCLRLAVEYARLRVMQTIADAGGSSEGLGAQQSLYLKWRKRCHAQLQMVGMCRSNGVYGMVPGEEKAYECPFSISTPYEGGGYYKTPGCLVYHLGGVYDPCRMSSDPCSAPGAGGPTPVSIADMVADPRSLLPFDPSLVGSDEALGTWPVVFSSSRGAEANGRMTDIVRDIEAWKGRDGGLPWRLSKDFVDANVVGGGSATPGGMGNTRSGGGDTWGTAEGFQAAEFCDAMADWWPDDWSTPAGYHVTVPCHSSEAGYRTFDHAFAIDRGGGEVLMVYENDLVRDGERYHSHYGTSGVCRAGSYGCRSSGPGRRPGGRCR